MRGAASITRPRGFRVCLLVFGLPIACTFPVHPDIKSKTNNATAVPSIKSGVAAVAVVAGARCGAFGCGGIQIYWPEGHPRLGIQASAASSQHAWSEHPAAHRVNEWKQVELTTVCSARLVRPGASSVGTKPIQSTSSLFRVAGATQIKHQIKIVHRMTCRQPACTTINPCASMHVRLQARAMHWAIGA